MMDPGKVIHQGTFWILMGFMALGVGIFGLFAP
jgi:hypothetical protein